MPPKSEKLTQSGIFAAQMYKNIVELSFFSCCGRDVCWIWRKEWLNDLFQSFCKEK